MTGKKEEKIKELKEEYQKALEKAIKIPVRHRS